jgi:hypothetical protein
LLYLHRQPANVTGTHHRQDVAVSNEAGQQAGEIAQLVCQQWFDPGTGSDGLCQ